MRRISLNKLIEWKKSRNRVPLILRGARQVGKTWLLKEFGRTQYEQVAYINFEKNDNLKSLFEGNINIPRIITALQIHTSITIDAENTLIIFDEIQSVPEAITSLKYFQEDAPQYHIVAAGSLLGVSMHSKASFPVGKVDFMDLYPMNFEEFLLAIGDDSLLNLLNSADWELIDTFKEKLTEKLKYYYFVGGMPDAVKEFSITRDFNQVRKIHDRILTAYENDFSKHAPGNIVPRIRMLWNSIPTQLGKENRKFIYGVIKEGARAKDYELSLDWLLASGLIYKVHRASKPGIPLKAYEDRNSFKLYIVDLGLLAAMGKIQATTLINGNDMFIEFKGAFTEQFVLQQFINNENFNIYYWSAERGTAEVDFLLNYNDKVFPIEVKAEENLKAKSLKIFSEKYSPEKSIRISLSGYRDQEWLVNIPLYAVSCIAKTVC